MVGNLKDLESHFEFGKNWERYSEIINEERIEEAKRGLERLVPREELEGKSFLDIGCGSGLHSLAALRLGASRIEAVDIDPRSVGTTKALLSRYAGNTSINVRQVSIFDLPASCSFEFDVVYSWGVLHHTGAMREAIRVASEFVKKGGVFTFALYRKTWTCRLWALEKRWYASASPKAQKRARSVFIALNRIVFALPLRGGSFRAFLEGYGKNRGMDFHIDLHDWMGGYPYESIAPNEVEDLMGEMGFQLERRYLVSDSFSSRLGVFGSGNDEYVYRKK